MLEPNDLDGKIIKAFEKAAKAAVVAGYDVEALGYWIIDDLKDDLDDVERCLLVNK